jgi:hypothetical protein
MLLYDEPLDGSPEAAAAVPLTERLDGMYAVEPLSTNITNVTD